MLMRSFIGAYSYIPRPKPRRQWCDLPAPGPSLYSSGHTWDNLPVRSPYLPSAAEQNNHTGFGFLFPNVVGGGGEGRGSRPSAEAGSFWCVSFQSVVWGCARCLSAMSAFHGIQDVRVFWSNAQ